jgi:hypothetical protein
VLLLQVTNDAKFTEHVEEMFNVEEAVVNDDDDDDSGYFSDRELSSSQEIKVNDDYFFAHLLDNVQDDTAFVTPKKADVPPVTTATVEHDAFSQDSSFALLDNCSSFQLCPNWKELSIADALLHNPRKDNPHQIVMCRLKCDHCRLDSTMGVLVGNEVFDDHYCNSAEWYDTQFIAGFCTLLYHDAHVNMPPRPPYTSDHKIFMVHCPYPSTKIKDVLPYPSDCTHFVSLVINGGHFAVLYNDLHAKVVSVFDGLNWKVTNWQKHIIYTVKSFGVCVYGGYRDIRCQQNTDGYVAPN